MAINYQNNGNGTSEAPRTWASLSNVEKFDLIDDAVKRELVEKAKAYHVNTDAEQARQTTPAESETRYF